MSSDNQDTPEPTPDPDSDGLGARDLIEALILETEAAGERAVTGIERFLHEPSVPRAIILWLGDRLRADRAWDWESVSTLLQADIALIDTMLNRMVNTILHQPKFQRLEASWREVKDGHGRIARISGEPGIGKSRLLRALNDNPTPFNSCSPRSSNT